jgi:hypothetical protein
MTKKLVMKVIESCAECPMASWHSSTTGRCMYMKPPVMISNTGGGFARWCALPDYDGVLRLLLESLDEDKE